MLVGITVLVLRWGSKRPYLLTGWLWYLGTLVPVIGLVQVGAQSMADRYSYLPFIGLFIIIAWMIPGPLANRQWEWGIKGAAVLGCLVLTQAQVRRWKDSKTLFTYATQVTAGSFIGHHNLGAVLVEEGQIEQGAYHFAEAVRINSKYAESHSDLGLACVLLGRVDEGIEHYRAALALKPNLDKTHYNLGSALATQGKQAEALKEYAAAVQLNAHYPEARRALALALAHAGQSEPAIPHFEQYLRLRPNDLDMHFDLARVLNSVGRKGEAADHLRQVLRLKADDAEAHERLGLILAETGQVQEAIGHFGEAARLRPTAQVRYELALALSIAGQRKQAIEQYRQALELKPDWPPALNDLAWILATDREAENRQGTEAVRLAERACELADGKEARFWGTLDAAYAEAGRFEDAIRAANRARELAVANGQAEVAEAAGKRLELYHGRKPFRQ
jgi:protein O-mannosyl-transferase